MFAKFKDAYGHIVRVVPGQVQGIVSQQHVIGGADGSAIICSGGKLIVSESPEEVEKELCKVAAEIEAGKWMSLNSCKEVK